MLEGDWRNQTSLNYITKCEIFFCVLAIISNGVRLNFGKQMKDTRSRSKTLCVSGAVLPRQFHAVVQLLCFTGLALRATYGVVKNVIDVVDCVGRPKLLTTSNAFSKTIEVAIEFVESVVNVYLEDLFALIA